MVVRLITYGDKKFKKSKLRLVTECKLFTCVDDVRSYGPEDIDDVYMKKHKQSFELNKQIWRPYIFLRNMEELKNNDVLIFVDAGHTANLQSEAILKKIIDQTTSAPIIAISCPGCFEKQYTKEFVFEKLNVPSDAPLRNTEQIQNGFVVMLKNDVTMQILKYWFLVIDRFPDLINDSTGVECKEFIANRDTQSVWSVILKQHGIKGLLMHAEDPALPLCASRKIDIPPFHVINLCDKRGEIRRKHVKQLEKYDIDIIFSPAVDTSTVLTHNVTKSVKLHGRELSNSEVALWKSHCRVYEKLLLSDDDYIIVAEDDLTANDHFDHNMRLLTNIANKIEFDAIKFEYNIYYNFDGTRVKNWRNQIAKERLKKLNLVKTKKNAGYAGAAGYFISRKGAKAFLELNPPDNAFLAADGVFDPFHHSENMQIYYTEIPLAFQEVDDEHIVNNGGRLSKNIIAFEGVFINLDRRKDRLEHMKNIIQKYSMFSKIERISAVADNNGAIGCGLSHIKALRSLKSKKCEYYLVLEDDFSISSNEIFTEFISDFEHQCNLFDWDLITLCPHSCRLSNVQTNSFFSKIEYSLTTVAYIIKKNFIPFLAMFFMDVVDEMKSGANKTIDVEWGRLFKEHNIYCYNKQFVTQIPGLSDVTKRKEDYKETLKENAFKQDDLKTLLHNSFLTFKELEYYKPPHINIPNWLD